MAQLFRFISLPESIQNQTKVEALKNRLDWGEPALTVIDVRDHSAFQLRHIVGAIPVPSRELMGWARSHLELTRDIYLYGETDRHTAEAAEQLRSTGYQHIAELTGGLEAWEKAQYPVEGISTFFG
jgi:rhodanese-related sulfurtransferase